MGSSAEGNPNKEVSWVQWIGGFAGSTVKELKLMGCEFGSLTSPRPGAVSKTGTSSGVLIITRASFALWHASLGPCQHHSTISTRDIHENHVNRLSPFVAMIALFVTALMRGWTSPYVAQLTAENSPLPITTDQASWVASLLNLGRLLGAIMGALSVYFFGSRKTLVVAGLPLSLSWAMVIVADSVTWLYLARFISGVGMGIVYCSFPLYLGEVSSPAIRGTLVTLALSGVTSGILAGNIMGTYVSMSVFSYASLVPTVVSILVFLWLPESPHDLTRRNKMEEAKRSIQIYNPMADADLELQYVNDFCNTAHSITFWERLKEFNLPQNRKAGLVIVLLFCFMQFGGFNTVTFYMETILKDAKLTVTEPATMVIIVNTIGTIAAFMAIYTADKYGRKVLLISSSVGICVSMIGLGVHFTLIDKGFDSENLQWLPIASLICYQVFFSLGHAIIPNMVLSELFAPHIKSIAACLTGIATGIFAFTSSKTYQPMIDYFGEAYVFWFHAVLMVLCIVFVLTLMPETKRKTLQEIQEKLGRK